MYIPSRGLTITPVLLVEDNRELHEEVARLQGELDQAQEESDRLQQELAAAQAQLAELLPPEDEPEA